MNESQMLQLAVYALKLYDIYVNTPDDRGGDSGPKAKAYNAFIAAKNEVFHKQTRTITQWWCYTEMQWCTVVQHECRCLNCSHYGDM